MLLLFGAAWLSAALLSWFLYAKTKAPQEEKKTLIVMAARDMPLGSLLRKGDIKLAAIPSRQIPKGSVLQERDALDRVLLYPISTNEPVLISKLSAATSTEGVSSTIERGYRAVSVQITDVTGVAGLIQPNSRVDVLFTRPGNMADAATSTILQNVRVLQSAGKTTQPGQAVDPRAPRSPVVTLVLKPADAQKLELAKNQGKISLALRNPLDNSPLSDGGPVTTDALDPEAAQLARAKKGRGSAADPKAWQDLVAQTKAAETKKAVEKPRVVIDVYRGDKHVQELFQ
jgi:pilus assembly protein CpaB